MGDWASWFWNAKGKTFYCIFSICVDASVLMHLELWMSHFSGVLCIICRIGLVWILELLWMMLRTRKARYVFLNEINKCWALNFFYPVWCFLFRVTDYSKKENLLLPKPSMIRYTTSLLKNSKLVCVNLLWFNLWFLLQVLCEFNHVNPQDDEEGKEFANTRVWMSLLHYLLQNN